MASIVGTAAFVVLTNAMFSFALTNGQFSPLLYEDSNLIKTFSTLSVIALVVSAIVPVLIASEKRWLALAMHWLMSAGLLTWFYIRP